MSTFKALLVGENNVPKVESISIPELKQGQVLIKSVAFAANPTDWKHLTFGLAHKDAIVGNDVSGYIEAVGPNTEGFEKGDIVSTTIRGSVSKTQGAFGEYVVANAVSTLKYDKAQFNADEKLSVGEHKSSNLNTFEAAASITLSLATIGVSFSHHLQLKADESNKDKFILIWGGATASGTVAIQVAKKIYGLQVITTASKKNHEFLKSLGADYVFDYNSSDVIEQIKKTGNGKIQYGLDTVSNDQTFQSVYDATEGSSNVRLDSLLFLNEKNLKINQDRENVPLGGTLVYVVDGEEHSFGDALIPSPKELVTSFTHFWTKLVPPHVKDIKSNNLTVLKAGLESANEAFDLLKNDKISASKVVFRYE